MNARTDTERILDAFLAPENDRLSDRVIDAALSDIGRTPQRRALRVPWRFPTMPAMSRATGIAAVALVAIVGAGGLIYLNSNGPSGAGSQGTPTPTATASQSVASTLPPGIPGWTPYTSARYGFTMAIPSDWRRLEAASQSWSAELAVIDSFPYADTFVGGGPGGPKEIGLHVWQMPAPGAIYSLSDGALFGKLCETIGRQECGGSMFAPRELCLGPFGLLENQEGCVRTFVSRETENPFAFVIDDERRVVTVFWVPRENDFPEAAKYGGTEALLMAIVGQLKVE